MVVDLNVEETLETMISEWESRIDQSLLRALDEEVTLYIDKTPYRIRTHYGILDIARQSGRNKFSIESATLTKLLFGSIPLSEVYAQWPRLITPQGRAMLDALFPQRFPSLTYLDRL